MKALIIYCSDYKKNTEKIANIFSKKINAELVNVNDMKNDMNVNSYDLIGFGSGVYKESMSPKIFKIAESLNLRDKRKLCLQGKFYCPRLF